MNSPATVAGLVTTDQPCRNSDPLREAVRAVYSAIRADFGPQFTAAMSDERDANAWKWRLYRKLDGIAQDVAIDGYERAVQERRPYMPSLVDIVGAARAIDCERTRAAEHVAEVTAPRINGFAGYVEHLSAANASSSVAAQHIERMREILHRPVARTMDERTARLDVAMAEHERLMASAPRIRHRGEYRGCTVPTCPRPGTHSHSLGGLNASWFCADHWRNT